jgi:hypothetical protein
MEGFDGSTVIHRHREVQISSRPHFWSLLILHAKLPVLKHQAMRVYKGSGGKLQMLDCVEWSVSCPGNFIDKIIKKDDIKSN